MAELVEFLLELLIGILFFAEGGTLKWRRKKNANAPIQQSRGTVMNKSYLTRRATFLLANGKNKKLFVDKETFDALNIHGAGRVTYQGNQLISFTAN